MQDSRESVVNELIRLEMALGDLYLFFQDIFQEDADFWWKLSLEERNHAALVQGGRDALLDIEELPDDLISVTADLLIKTSDRVDQLMTQYKEEGPERTEAFAVALELEESAGEIHFQKAMESLTPGGALKILQKLNGSDKNHAERIRAYMSDNGICLPAR